LILALKHVEQDLRALQTKLFVFQRKTTKAIDRCKRDFFLMISQQEANLIENPCEVGFVGDHCENLKLLSSAITALKNESHKISDQSTTTKIAYIFSKLVTKK
jgi:hypothetical protein